MRKHPISALASLGAALLAVCALTAACSATSAAPTAAGGAAQTSAAQAAGGSAAAGSGAGGPAKVTCDQLTAADVQGLMTDPVVGKPEITPEGTNNDGQQCEFSNPDSGQAIDVIVAPESDPAMSYEVQKQQADNPVPVSGVGDQAFRDGDDDEPTAEHGGVVCGVTIGADDQIPGTDKLVTGGNLNITDAQKAIVATALGTVCNRIFGSGDTTPDLSAL